MTREHLLAAMGLLDDDLIREAEEPVSRKKWNREAWISLAACLAMMSLHAAAEAGWSISVYQTFALSVLALLCVVYDQPVAKLTGGT